MNALIWKNAGLIVAVTALPLLAGCALGQRATVDTSSPLAPRVVALVDANRTYPRWEDFPQQPEGLLPPAQVASNVAALHSQNAALDGEVSRIEWTLGDPAQIAADVRAQIGAVPVSPDSVQTAADIEAFAEELRERAKAPPPIDRRPQP